MEHNKAFSWMFLLQQFQANLRSCSTGWLSYSVCRPTSQLVAKFALTQRALAILTWLFLFIKLHNLLGFFFLPVWDMVYKKETSHSINVLPGNPTVVCWNRLKKDPHLDVCPTQPSSMCSQRLFFFWLNSEASLYSRESPLSYFAHVVVSHMPLKCPLSEMWPTTGSNHRQVLWWVAIGSQEDAGVNTFNKTFAQQHLKRRERMEMRHWVSA